MKTLVEIAIESITMTDLNTRSYINLRDNVAGNRNAIIASLNEAQGKAMMAFQLLLAMGKADEGSKVLDYFDKEIAPDFQEMLQDNQ